jgi:hypothetical protein
MLRPYRNECASYRPKVPIAAVKDSLEQSQSGFQSEFAPKERFLNRDSINLLTINNLQLQNWSLASLLLVPDPRSGKFEEKSFHNVPKGFQERQNSVPLKAGLPITGAFATTQLQ